MSNLSRSNFDQQQRKAGAGLLAVMLLSGIVIALSWMVYSSFRIDVGEGEIAILTHKVGSDLTNAQEVAPDETYKGIQKKVLTEGRYFYNPYSWSWEVVRQTEVMSGEMGVMISLTGDDLGYGEYLAKVDAEGNATTKGIMPGSSESRAIPDQSVLVFCGKATACRDSGWLQRRDDKSRRTTRRRTQSTAG